jgi:hypothetical protein
VELSIRSERTVEFIRNKFASYFQAAFAHMDA